MISRRSSSPLPAALAALLFACLALPAPAVARPSPDGTPERSLLFEESVWANYTNKPNAFYLGPKLVGASSETSDTACATLCNADPACLWWSWCSLTAVEGCGVVRYCNSTEEFYKPGTCLLSTEIVPQGRYATSTAVGPAVLWSGGYYRPQQDSGSNTGGGLRRLRVAAAENTAEKATAAARAKSLGVRSAGASGRALRAVVDPDVWSRFNRLNNTYFRGPSVVGAVAATTEEECASACGDEPLCKQWALCPVSATQGCEALEFCDVGVSQLTANAGTCLLSYDPVPGRDAYVSMIGAAVSWSAGYLQEGGAAGPGPAPVPDLSPGASPSPSPSPFDSPSPSPDLSPSPSPSPSQSPSPGSSPSGAPAGPNGECPEGFEECGGLCVNTKGDNFNCGFCGNRCWRSGEMCLAGLCSCPIGGRVCGTGCANILMDPYNCGSCGWSCSFGQSCFGGVCS